jgi:hypothetical protein
MRLVEARFFRLSGVWFLGGLATGLWMLGLYPLLAGRPLLPAAVVRLVPFDRVRDLHVSWLLMGWLGMLLAGALLRLGRRGGRTGGEAAAAAALALWLAWGAAAAVVYLGRPGPRWVFVWHAAFVIACGLAVAAAAGWRAGPAALLAVVTAGLGASLWLAPAAPARSAAAASVLPSLAVFQTIVAVVVAACGWALTGRRAGAAWSLAGSAWAAAAWCGGPLAAPAAGAALLAAAGVAPVLRRAPRTWSLAFLAYAVVVVAAMAVAPAVDGGRALNALAVAAALSACAIAAAYALAAAAPTGAAARRHWLSHVLGFSALVAGLQAAPLPAAAGPVLAALDGAAIWAGALAVAAGASAFVLTLNRGRPRATLAGPVSAR